MTTTPITAILGASDPEMSAIERILRDAGARVLYAAGPGATRVHPGNAYRATHLCAGGAEVKDLRDREVWLIECAPARDAWWHTTAASARRIDHHRPGDPGYGRPPAEFLNASSLGQTVAALCSVVSPQHTLAPVVGVGSAHVLIDTSWWGDGGPIVPQLAIVSKDLALTAAADHCLAAAYAGQCPGVDPEKLARWRAESRAQHRGKPVAEILSDIDRATAAPRAAPTTEIAGVRVADLGSTTVPEAPEAAARIGLPFLATVVEPDHGRRKRVLQAAPYDVVAAWLEAMQVAGRETYGDPARGFAGACEEWLPEPGTSIMHLEQWQLKWAAWNISDLTEEEREFLFQLCGIRVWWRDEKCHREDGPAVEYASGRREWWRDGELHREDGPAVVRADGSLEWWHDGKLLHIEQPRNGTRHRTLENHPKEEHRHVTSRRPLQQNSRT